MISALVLFALVSAAPLGPPPGCRVESAPGELVVKSGGAEARYALTGDEDPGPRDGRPPRVTVVAVPGVKDQALAGFAEDWEGVQPPLGSGRLYRIGCGPSPSIQLAMVAPGIDFGRVVVTRDGRLVVGGWGGLRVLDPLGVRLLPLTAPPPWPAPRCWSAEENKPARAADVPLVGEAGLGSSEGAAAAGDLEEVHFIRTGACGYEGAMRAIEHALVLDRGIVRPIRSIPAVAASGDGRVLVGDGDGRCEQQTPGTLFSTSDGVSWSRVVVAAKGVTGIRGVTRLPAGPWLALSAVCDTGASLVGGDLFMSADLVSWEPVRAIPEGMTRVGSGGLGLTRLMVEGGRAYVAALPVEQKQPPSWFESADGRSWRPSGPRVAARPPQALAKILGVQAIHGLGAGLGGDLAWTSDGLFRRELRDAPWVRIFPR